MTTRPRIRLNAPWRALLDAREDFHEQVFSRRRSLVKVLILTSLLWLLSLAFVLWHRPASWPWDRPGRLHIAWWDVALFIWITEFLFVKSWLMWVRNRVKTWLGVSLTTVNAVFGLAYYSVLAQAFYPQYRHLDDVRIAVRAGLAFAVTWAVVRLSMTVDVDERRPSMWEVVGMLQEELALNRQELEIMKKQLAAALAQNAALWQQLTGTTPIDAPFTPS